jgi:signal transduction histidine kinase
MRKRISLLQMAVFFFTAQVAWAGNIKTEKVTLVGNGLLNMKKRMEEIGGNFAIHSEIGKGTSVNVELLKF